MKREGKKANGVEGVRWREGREGRSRRKGKDKTYNTTKNSSCESQRINIFHMDTIIRNNHQNRVVYEIGVSRRVSDTTFIFNMF